MKLTLKNGTVLDAVGVEESFYPRNAQGVILNIRMNSGESIDALRGIFTPDALETITVGEGGDAKTIAGYTQIDSMRRLYDGKAEYDTAVDLVKKTG